MKEPRRSAIVCLLVGCALLAGVSSANALQLEPVVLDLLAEAEAASWTANFPRALLGYALNYPVYGHFFVEVSVGHDKGKVKPPPHDQLTGPGKTKYAVGTIQRTKAQFGDYKEHKGLQIAPPLRNWPRQGDSRPFPYTEGIWKDIDIPFNGVLVWDGAMFGPGISEEKCNGVGVTIGIRETGTEEWEFYPRDLVKSDVVAPGRYTGAQGGNKKPLGKYFGKNVEIAFQIDDNGQRKKRGGSWGDAFMLEKFQVELASDYEKFCVDTTFLLNIFKEAFQGVSAAFEGDSISFTVDSITTKLSADLPDNTELSNCSLVAGSPVITLSDRYNRSVCLEFDFSRGDLNVQGNGIVGVPDATARPAFEVYGNPQVVNGKLTFVWGGESSSDVDADHLGALFEDEYEQKFHDGIVEFIYSRLPALLNSRIQAAMADELALLGASSLERLRAAIMLPDGLCLMSEKERAKLVASLEHQPVLTAATSEEDRSYTSFVRYHEGPADKVALSALVEPTFSGKGGKLFFMFEPALLGETEFEFSPKLVVDVPKGFPHGFYAGLTELRTTSGKLLDQKAVTIVVVE